MEKVDRSPAAVTVRGPLFLLFASFCMLLCGLFSFSLGLFFLLTVTLATATQALLFAAGRFFSPLVLTVASMALSFFTVGDLWILPAVAAPTLGGFLLARGMVTFSPRIRIASTLLPVYFLTFLFACLFPVIGEMLAAGETDFFAYLDRFFGAALQARTENLVSTYRQAADMYAQMGLVLQPIEEGAVKELLLFGASLLPSLFLICCGLPALLSSYCVQLIGLCCNRVLYPAPCRVFRPSALYAGAYLLMMPLGFLWGDFRDSLCFICLNYAVFMTPVLALGALFATPRLIAFMRRMSVGSLDFVFFLVLLIIFFLVNFPYMLLFLASAYAVYLLKSTFFPRKQNGKG